MKKRYIFIIIIMSLILVLLGFSLVKYLSVIREELSVVLPIPGENIPTDSEDFTPTIPDGEEVPSEEPFEKEPFEEEPIEEEPFEDPSTITGKSSENVFQKNAYYYNLLDDAGKAAYEQILQTVTNREESAQVYITDDSQLDRIYHGLLKDHPEIFWIHNRKEVYKTTYSNRDYCLFTPSYLYTDGEMQEILQSMERAYQDILQLLPNGADTYETVKTVYTYLIDEIDYVESEHDQSIAGAFWKKQAVCAGYAGAMQYLLERLQIPCIYVDGSVEGRSDGHAWVMVQIDGAWYYVDATNGDQPEFLSGDFVQLAEHKTILMDYLCPFPWEYERNYHAAEEYELPACTSTDKNFYVLNQGIFSDYDWQKIYDYCCMRINNNAAVVRFKFSDQDSFDQAVSEWVNGAGIQDVAQYYMQRNGLNQVEYHYGVLEDLKTIYFIF